MAIGDIVFMNMDGSYVHRLAASSEWRFHRDILHPGARPTQGRAALLAGADRPRRAQHVARHLVGDVRPHADADDLGRSAGSASP